jgi:thiol peroxidase
MRAMHHQFAIVLLAALCSAALAAADAGRERPGLVHGRGGADLTLVGPALEVGKPAPPATLRDSGLQAHRLRTWNDGVVRIVTTAPSLDTPTCSKQAHAFSARAGELSGKFEVIYVSRDLPFAQSRFCAAEGIKDIRVLSDYYDGSFAHAWGLFLKENGLLARAAVVVDGQGVVRYIQIVPDLPKEPDYDAVLAAAKAPAALTAGAAPGRWRSREPSAARAHGRAAAGAFDLHHRHPVIDQTIRPCTQNGRPIAR